MVSGFGSLITTGSMGDNRREVGCLNTTNQRAKFSLMTSKFGGTAKGT